MKEIKGLKNIEDYTYEAVRNKKIRKRNLKTSYKSRRNSYKKHQKRKIISSQLNRKSNKAPKHSKIK